jgi:hypothetical protein
MPRASVMRCPRSGLIARLSRVRISALTGPGLRGSFPGRNPHPILKAISRQHSALTGTSHIAEKQQTKGNPMIMTLTVFKEVHNTWPAKNGKPAGESYDLLCMDISNPPEHRMEEMLYYRTKEDERPKVWGKSVGNTIQVGVSKIRHGDNGGKATLLGSIITEAKKN